MRRLRLGWFQTESRSTASVTAIAAGASHVVERVASAGVTGGVTRARTPSHVNTQLMIHNMGCHE
jgi:hypothetical protein